MRAYKYIIFIVIVALLFAVIIKHKNFESSRQLASTEMNDDYLDNLNNNVNILISDKKTAEAYGGFALKKAFPYYYKKLGNVKWHAEETDMGAADEKVWRVTNYSKNSDTTSGEFCVLFRKNGQIMNFYKDNGTADVMK